MSADTSSSAADPLPPLAVTMGDPAGIGGEITLKAWAGRHEEPVPPFFAIDDPQRLSSLARRFGLDVDVTVIEAPADAADVFERALPVLPEPLTAPAEPGLLEPANADSTRAAIERAVRLTMQGQAAAVVTNPINKHCMHQAGFSHPGHTEYLAELAGVETPPVMMLACPELRVVPVTIHVSLVEAIAELNTGDIVTKARITANALYRDFGIARPRLAVAGLNPHAGESGAMGVEDATVVAPAVEILRAEGIDARGPLPPDTMFHAHARQTYDAAICMYHDQALIPLKTIDFDGGVNVTLGLPFVRTSPDHGTALNIAAKGEARPTSLIAALRLAAELAWRRRGG